MPQIVRAAGGVILKANSSGIRVLIAHRPNYDDWSFPKGKADPGETPEETALREVLEETGQRCRIVTSLGATRYRVGKGIKEVSWFAMRPLPTSPGFKKNKEVDAIKWVSRKRAKSALNYEQDRDLLATHDLKKISQTGSLFLLRHAAAGKRHKWQGDDRERPITKKGKNQAEMLAKHFETAEIERIVTSPYKRCVQTVRPIAKAVGAKIEVSDALAEGPNVEAAYRLAHNLVGSNAILCSHGDVIPAVMNRMMWASLVLESPFECEKGSVWNVEIDGGRFTTARYTAPLA